MKNTIIIVLILLVLGFGGYVLTRPATPLMSDTDPTAQENKPVSEEVATTTDMTKEMVNGTERTVIGKSIEKRNITAYHYGTGTDEVLLVGGIHGGYSWNTSLVAFEAMKYLKANPTAIPSNVTVTVIPVLNPDGLAKVTGKEGEFVVSDITATQAVQASGRFNVNEVDLNRNFDCAWQATGMWQNKPVSAGSAVFSEPESMAVKAYIESTKPKAVIVWYSAAGGVYSSSCDNGVLPATKNLTDVFAKASGYPAHESFDFYETTGDMANWLAKVNIPAISVLLTNHTDTEWTKNKAGIEAVLKIFAK
ncbi:MAG: hypothetical protein COV91_02640 [Candidatus Taylorbacteria bacterium CG11_big_fil_rev_8_21_14_0_20_46_11]|uniref:Peptidase M14 domain-containing protein n=1 Tax=Candidatus Taylorbacteria bacterium CG11_big_fil_rev_8_21_14_0_20_46_11 TaxID=1975025 RepID=A0A2H0KBX4_9BACT|nr:MAG: hypothetical protein COV91_02640 [Candidatus Taylorbacteria bacterium CG11_big_fil_rev_8_21_14_0_20_46_11]